MMHPDSASCYLIDIEGVLVRDKRYEPIPGSVDWFNGLSDRGIRSCLVSNNTTHSPAQLVGDLHQAGFQASEDRLVSALELAVDILFRWGKRRIMWLGIPRLADYWREHGFQLTAEGECDAVVLGANPELQLQDLERALPALLDHRAELVALHRNLFFLDGDGRRRLGPGAWCAALETLAGDDSAVCIGKPSTRIFREALNKIGAEPREALFISDDPIADLVKAKQLGMRTAFVLCGKYPDHGVLGRLNQEEWPDIIVERPENLD